MSTATLEQPLEQAPAAPESTRRLATLETVIGIEPIEGADAIEIACVRGWEAVVRKGEFHVGDTVIYVEVDAALPLSDPRFEFLGARSSRIIKDTDGTETAVHVLKTVRLRGVYSQGLILPAADFPEARGILGFDPTIDLDTALGITKWDPPVKGDVGHRRQHNGIPFPGWITKTDAERVQNLSARTWASIQSYGGSWEAVEKVDGMSLTAWGDLEDGHLRVASRNWELPETDAAHWRAARMFELARRLGPGMWVQGEVAGEGIQGNPLGLEGLHLFIFGIGYRGERFTVTRWPRWAIEARPPVHPLQLPETVKETVKQVETITSLIVPGKAAEGVVWTNRWATAPAGLSRPVFKSLSAKYLLKH